MARHEQQISRGSRRGDSEHSELRLCRQVERRLHLVFAGELGDPALQGVSLHSVLPGPPGQLVVRVITDGSQPYDLVRFRLEAARARLRGEVASAIHRRRTPDLVFIVLDPENDSDADTDLATPDAHDLLRAAALPRDDDDDDDLDDDLDDDDDDDLDDDDDDDLDDDFDDDDDDDE